MRLLRFIAALLPRCLALRNERLAAKLLQVIKTCGTLIGQLGHAPPGLAAFADVGPGMTSSSSP